VLDPPFGGQLEAGDAPAQRLQTSVGTGLSCRRSWRNGSTTA
jgi:hypothetical protein